MNWKSTAIHRHLHKCFSFLTSEAVGCPAAFPAHIPLCLILFFFFPGTVALFKVCGCSKGIKHEWAPQCREIVRGAYTICWVYFSHALGPQTPRAVGPCTLFPSVNSHIHKLTYSLAFSIFFSFLKSLLLWGSRWGFSQVCISSCHYCIIFLINNWCSLEIWPFQPNVGGRREMWSWILFL